MNGVGGSAGKPGVGPRPTRRGAGQAQIEQPSEVDLSYAMAEPDTAAFIVVASVTDSVTTSLMSAGSFHAQAGLAPPCS